MIDLKPESDFKAENEEEENLFNLIEGYSRFSNNGVDQDIADSFVLRINDNLQSNYMYIDKITQIIDKKGNDLFLTEKGCLLANFFLLFGESKLSKKRLNFLNDGLQKQQKTYEIISELDSKIKELRKFVFIFFEEYKKNKRSHQEEYILSKTGNDLADLIIKTDINRMIAFQNNHFAGKGPDNTFTMSLKEFDDKFIISLGR